MVKQAPFAFSTEDGSKKSQLKNDHLEWHI